MENLHNADDYSSKQKNNSNCCSLNQEMDSNCCPLATPLVEEKKGTFKKGLGFVILGLAFVLAVSSAFKIATGSDELGFIPPSIEDFEWMDTDKEVVYILLKGDDDDGNQRLSKEVSDVIVELNESGSPVDYYELNGTHQHYDNFKETIGLEESPTVVVLGRVGDLSLFSNETVSPIKLYKAYVTASTPVAFCNPTACDPSKSCTPAQKATCGVKKSN